MKVSENVTMYVQGEGLLNKEYNTLHYYLETCCMVLCIIAVNVVYIELGIYV